MPRRVGDPVGRSGDTIRNPCQGGLAWRVAYRVTGSFLFISGIAFPAAGPVARGGPLGARLARSSLSCLGERSWTHADPPRLVLPHLALLRLDDHRGVHPLARRRLEGDVAATRRACRGRRGEGGPRGVFPPPATGTRARGRAGGRLLPSPRTAADRRGARRWPPRELPHRPAAPRHPHRRGSRGRRRPAYPRTALSRASRRETRFRRAPARWAARTVSLARAAARPRRTARARGSSLRRRPRSARSAPRSAGADRGAIAAGSRTPATGPARPCVASRPFPRTPACVR